MGKQIQICTNEVDNLEFERFLVETFDCKFYQNFSNTVEGLQIKSINEYKSQIRISNPSFKWIPEYAKTNKENLIYISNISTAPVIEFIHTNWVTNRHGRLYWSKYFASNNIDYDVVEFERFYNKVANWLKKNAKGKTKYFGINLYFLENAWKASLEQNLLEKW